ncbi:lytic transglycosylase domain-containing protein [Rhizobium terrae]|uniref:lytic transglycosylase domain-containing protein n=1 Tax=Rhizobium terrae TaxID=2171756 RepID=UPI000E3B9B9A|nr:transglycosylase SLT domain-containing protein [Rhizobium terrae]
MKNVVLAAAAGLAMLVAGGEIVSAQDINSTTDYASLTTDAHPDVNVETEETVRIYTKPLIIPWETRETGFAAPTASDRRLVRKLHYTRLISQYADEYGVPVELAHAVVQVESNFRPTVKGRAGEIGLMQIKPATARLMGYKGPDYGLYDPETNIRYGMKYLAGAHDLGDGKVCGTILKYNAGHAAKRMNPVSKRYCEKVEAILDTDDLETPGSTSEPTLAFQATALSYPPAAPLIF